MELLAGDKVSSYVPLIYDGGAEPAAQEVQGVQVLHGDFPSMFCIQNLTIVWSMELEDTCSRWLHLYI